MSQTSPQAQDNASRSIGAERFLSFSDAVVAIAATLLVLPLVDAVATAKSTDTVLTLLTDNKETVFAFVLSFFVIYRFWTAHHLIFGGSAPLTPALRWLNGVWLFSIVFLPVPTRLIGANKTNTGWDALYIGTLLVAVVTTEASHWLIARLAGQPALETTLSVLPMPVATVVALVLAIAVPSIGLWALLLLFGAGLVQNQFLRPWAARGASAQGEPDRPAEQAEQEQATGAPGV
jgi:uncharacterized membrane protein